ncbi:hypothetical protein AGMMS49992_02620 [Clostridia bacterium]|nr:hypothetical protein AGMMS49992_02620 [Clostridia bacterium]
MKKQSWVLFMLILSLCIVLLVINVADASVLDYSAEKYVAPPESVTLSLGNNMRYAVYTGPGENYYRSNNGNASVNTNDWICIFGIDDGWILIEHAVDENTWRRGYIPILELPGDTSIPQLEFINQIYTLSRSCFITDDPQKSQKELAALSIGDNVTLLYRDGEWAYIEAQTSKGLVRGYIKSAFIDQVSLLVRPQVAPIVFASPYYSEKITITNDKTVNIRTGPGLSYQQIGEVYPGSSFYYTGVTTDSWYQILYPAIEQNPGYNANDAIDSQRFYVTAYVNKGLSALSPIDSNDAIYSSMIGNLMVKTGARIYYDAGMHASMKGTVTEYEYIPFAGVSQYNSYAVLFNKTDRNGHVILWIGFISAKDVIDVRYFNIIED